MIGKLIYSIRPSACLGVGLFAASAYQDASDPMILTTIFLSAFAGAAGCFLLNDLFDVRKDILNNKKRPIATGELPREIAISSSVIFLLFYAVASIYLGIYCFIISCITILAFITYPRINNKFGLVSNILVALNVALAFFYGGVLNQLDEVLMLVITSVFFVTISREIMLDALDKKGDSGIGKSSIPLSVSARNMTLIVLGGYLLGSIPILWLVSRAPFFTIFGLTLIAVLWLPLIVRLFFPRIDWILFNIRFSHTYFGLMIAFLFLR